MSRSSAFYRKCLVLGLLLFALPLSGTMLISTSPWVNVRQLELDSHATLNPYREAASNSLAKSSLPTATSIAWVAAGYPYRIAPKPPTIAIGKCNSLARRCRSSNARLNRLPSKSVFMTESMTSQPRASVDKAREISGFNCGNFWVWPSFSVFSFQFSVFRV